MNRKAHARHNCDIRLPIYVLTDTFMYTITFSLAFVQNSLHRVLLALTWTDR
jgi:hypothetical protein